MKAARVIVLAVALAAGGAAAFLIGSDDAKKSEAPPVAQLETTDNKNAPPATSETILTNVRVLAIDQTVEEKSGQRVVVGKTATLEIAPRQAETLALARQLGTLSLALRSLLDASKVVEEDDRKPDINTVRYGVSNK